MRLLADLHTHTVASGHAYSTVTENVQVARARGLELIAVTDHGPRVPQGAHAWHFWNLKVIPSVLDGVRILKGCEANLAPDTENGLDLPDQVLALLDLVSIGFHPGVGYDERDRSRNTEALLKAMANPLVDQVTHPGNDEDFPVEMDAVVRAAVQHNVILELNEHTFAPASARAATTVREREFAQAANDASAPIAIGSDAHYALYVGKFDAALEVAREIGLTEDRIVNRSADSVLAHITSKRSRPYLEVGGHWDSVVAPT